MPEFQASSSGNTAVILQVIKFTTYKNRRENKIEEIKKKNRNLLDLFKNRWLDLRLLFILPPSWFPFYFDCFGGCQNQHFFIFVNFNLLILVVLLLFNSEGMHKLNVLLVVFNIRIMLARFVSTSTAVLKKFYPPFFSASFSWICTIFIIFTSINSVGRSLCSRRDEIQRQSSAVRSVNRYL